MSVLSPTEILIARLHEVHAYSSATRTAVIAPSKQCIDCYFMIYQNRKREISLVGLTLQLNSGFQMR